MSTRSDRSHLGDLPQMELASMRENKPSPLLFRYEAVTGLPRLPDLPKLDLSLLSVGEARGKYENGQEVWRKQTHLDTKRHIVGKNSPTTSFYCHNRILAITPDLYSGKLGSTPSCGSTLKVHGSIP